MEMCRSVRRRIPARGFTLIEVVVALTVLAIGLVAMASLMGQMVGGTSRSKYMSLAATLASEKLEDLNRWPASDPHIAIPTGSTAGSLTSDLVQNVTIGATTTSVNYFDRIFFSTTTGAVSQTVSGLDAGGNPVYTTTSHQANGTAGSATGTTPQVPLSATVPFRRRWIIEKDTPITGVRRITVLVMLEDNTVRPPVTFQMSTVRP